VNNYPLPTDKLGFIDGFDEGGSIASARKAFDNTQVNATLHKSGVYW
jgi:hypothetical protein